MIFTSSNLTIEMNLYFRKKKSSTELDTASVRIASFAQSYLPDQLLIEKYLDN